MTATLIDTRLWALAWKYPFMPSSDPAFRLAGRAHEFLRGKTSSQNRILISSQLAAEIYHVLTKRGRRLAPDQAAALLNELLGRKLVIYRHITQRVFERAMETSSKSGIHIWDYLVVLPFEGEVEVIYTMDPHMRDATFRQIGRVENPLGIWKTEGED